MKRFTRFGSALTVIGLAVLGLSAAASIAQSANNAPMIGRGGGPRAMMMLADSNNDGVLSAAEIAAHQNARFDQMDANHDGQVSSDEMGPPNGAAMGGNGGMMAGQRTVMREQRQQQMLTAMDSDSNGTISRDEFTAFEGHRMTAADSNHDGQLDQDEINAMVQNMGGPGQQ
jgi:hypothetical protein